MLSNTATPIYYGMFRDQVIRGIIPVNEEVSLAMNLIDDLIQDPRYYYDDSAINGFIEFCEKELTLTDGSEVSMLDSFKLWAEDLLGWFYFVDEKVFDQELKRYIVVQKKKRLRNTQYIILGRGGAKSMYASFIHAYGLYIDADTTSQVVTAPTMRQAQETTMPIATAITVARGPLMKFLTAGDIKSRTHTKVKTASTKKGIENYITNSLIQILPMSIDKLQGYRTKIASVDEWLSGNTRENVIEALEQNGSKIDNWIVLATSSEGTARDGVGDTIKIELKNILNGDIYNPHVSIWHYKLDDIKEINNPELWLKANPNLGQTVSYDVYQKAVHTAETVPSKRNDIIAKRFGIPVEGLTYYFTYEETLCHPKRDFRGMECIMGMDLSQGDDFCAFTFLFPLNNDSYGIMTRSYVSRHKYNKLHEATRDKYDEFVNEGTLVIMDKNVLNMMDVYDDLDNYIEENDLVVYAVGYDPYNARDFIERWTKENGSFGVEKVIQGAKTESVPLGELKALAESRLLIFYEELMKFAMGNSIVIKDNNDNMKLSKKRSSEKIDNVTGLLCAWVAYKRTLY